MHRQGLEVAPIPQIIRPFAQQPSRNMIVLVRTNGSVAGLADIVRERIAAVDPTVPLYNVTTVKEVMDRSLAQRRFQTWMLGLRL